ncbi:Defensin-like protein [Quillaja saponaria]|uniref:Defensin-like protein n=1 Tax=Quillaja saponaria TaxID=32244 RepID=A0AAD7P5G1_QUISA|nr:Defensin-like protein [Quillaja saponaria]
MERKSFGLFFLLLIVLTAHESVMQTEAKICQAPSGKFKGPCFADSACSSTCKNKDHLLGGVCQGFACYCQRNC